MNLSKVLTRSTLLAIALLNLSLATSAVAEPVVIPRGSRGAARIVDSEKLPIDAIVLPSSRVSESTKLKQNEPQDEAELINQSTPERKEMEQATRPRLTRRGSHGAFTLFGL